MMLLRALGGFGKAKITHQRSVGSAIESCSLPLGVLMVSQGLRTREL